VRIDDESKTATVLVPDKSLSLAIGKEGQNARLAARLTGWRIDIKSLTTALEEGAPVKTTEGPSVEATMLVHDPELASAKAESRKVRADATIVYQKVSFGPFPESYIGKEVRLRATSQAVYIYDGEQLLTSFRRGEAAGPASARPQMVALPPAAAPAPPIPPEVLAALGAARPESRKVAADGSVTYKRARYGPLPSEQTGQQVQVRGTDEYLGIYAGGEIIAVFRREEGDAQE